MVDVIKALGLLSVMRRSHTINKKNSIVFVPGLYGSMGDDIIPGTGKWSFGMAASIYEPFIKKLVEMGYVLEENLFIAFYDWRKECSYSMEKYLKPVIEHAKRKNKSKKVDIICHSMGGLVSRTYVQSKNYNYDVDQMIFIATPHTGAANAYSIWTEGKLLSKKNIESEAFATLMEGYLWILTRLHGYDNDIDTVHNLLKGAKDLLPNRDYGEYIYYFDQEKKLHYIPYEELDYKNSFLDNLNQNKDLLKQRRIRVTLIVGKNIETNEKFQINKSDDNEDSKIVSVIKTSEGDGTVSFRSATAIEGDTYIFHADHTDIMKKCSFAIKSKLGIMEETVNDGSIVDSYTGKEEEHVSILMNGKGKVSIHMQTDEGTKLMYDSTKNVNNVFIQEFSDMLKWIVIHNVGNKQLYLDYEPEENETLDIQAKSSSGRKIKFRQQRPVKGKNYRMKIQ